MSKQSIELIGRQWFANDLVIAAFSTANLSISTEGQPIAGLDLGINTSTDLESTQQNRARMLQEMGLNPGSLAYAKQVHSTTVLKVDGPGCYPDTDGFVTNVPGVSLGILVADCAAVLIADTSAGVIGAFHAGWRGAAGGILDKGIGMMRDLGGSSFRAWVSPCIGLEAFEVGDDVAAAFPDPFVDRVNYSKPHVDLAGFVRHTLETNGLPSLNIHIDGRCTVSDENFYSFRRQRDRSGRMMGVIALR